MIAIEEFYSKYQQNFDEQNCYQIDIETGENFKDDIEKVNFIQKRMKYILDYIFSNKEIYVILFIWNVDRNTIIDLFECGFHYDKFDQIIKNIQIKDIKLEDDPPNTEVQLLYSKAYQYEKIQPIVQAIAGNEILVKPSADISAYFILFEEDRNILVNLYDDRGIEILSPHLELKNYFENETRFK